AATAEDSGQGARPLRKKSVSDGLTDCRHENARNIVARGKKTVSFVKVKTVPPKLHDVTSDPSEPVNTSTVHAPRVDTSRTRGSRPVSPPVNQYTCERESSLRHVEAVV
ncbi:unnamed protein product, partial [Sphacelaria rigidula]